eukprot:Skav209604  [mRNA]  locus=scaffold1634:115749:116959:- [translate_table: standard]
MTSQELRRRLEAVEDAAPAAELGLFDPSEIDEDIGKAALISRLQAAEEARIQELLDPNLGREGSWWPRGPKRVMHVLMASFDLLDSMA